MRQQQILFTMMRRYSRTCAGEESKLLFQKTKETERREKEEDLKDLTKNRMQKDQQQKGSFQKLKWDLEELS